MAENQIQSISNTHERIMDWLLQNPEKSLKECAAHFHYSQAWLSTIINSDAFKARMAELHAEVHFRVAGDIPARLARIADIALDRIADVVANTDNLEDLVSVGDSVLSKLGYGGKSSAPAPAVQNNFTVTVNDLSEARRMLTTPAPAVIDAEVVKNDNS